MTYRIRDCEEPVQSWDDVVEQLSYPPHNVLLPLVDRIRQRGLGRSIRGAGSMNGLYLDMDRTPYGGHPCLLIAPAGDKTNHFRFKFQDWQADYPPEQAEAALLRFLVRAGWFPKGHPMLADPPSGESR